MNLLLVCFRSEMREVVFFWGGKMRKILKLSKKGIDEFSIIVYNSIRCFGKHTASKTYWAIAKW